MGWSGPTEEGTPQGGPLSPLLSNLMLDVLDKELEKRGHRFVRYADDCNIYVRSQRAGERVMASIEKFLTRRLKLKINKAKSTVAKPSVRKFLGFSFTSEEQPRRRIAPQALAHFKSRVHELTRRTRGASPKQIVKELSGYLVGWRGYFGFCETPSVLRKLDQWLRRRLRAIGGLMDTLTQYGNDAVRIVYDVANAHFIGEDFTDGLRYCRERLALVHLSDTGREIYRHDPVGLGTVPFTDVPRALAAVGCKARPMLEIISRDPDRDIIASASKFALLGFTSAHQVQ